VAVEAVVLRSSRRRSVGGKRGGGMGRWHRREEMLRMQALKVDVLRGGIGVRWWGVIGAMMALGSVSGR
jgi:hypothetical protein